MKNRRFTTVTALLLLCSTMLAAVSCASDKPDTANSDTTAADTQATEAADTSPGADLPDYDGKGAEFVILSRSEAPFDTDFDLEAETGDTINDATYLRDRTVEERLNVDIKALKIEGDYTKYDNFHTYFTQSIMAGSNDFQLVSGYTYRIASTTLDGSFVDWYTVPYIDLEKPWWAEGFLEAASINNHSYIITGDLSSSFLQFTYAVFFNKNMAEAFDVSDVYGIVKDGKWTLDKMEEIGAEVSADLNGDGVMDHTDRWGFVTGRSTRTDAFLYAFEVPLSARDNDGIPYLLGVTEKYQQVIEAVNDLLWNNSVGYLYWDYSATDETIAVFTDGHCLFTPNRLFDASFLRDMDDDFGIIPYPKWDEAQEDYHTYYDDRCSSFAVPVTAPDLELVGIVTELMAAKSYEFVRPAIYEVALKTKYARDDDSQEMIDMILDSMIFEFTNIYAYSFGNQQSPAHSLRINVRKNSNDLTSYFATLDSVYTETMEKLISSVTGQ